MLGGAKATSLVTRGPGGASVINTALEIWP
jgi:hypothetical protein